MTNNKDSPDNSLQKIIQTKDDSLLLQSYAEKYTVSHHKNRQETSSIADLNYIPTGFKAIDQFMNGGLKRGSIYSISARPAMGKTALISSIIRNISLNYSANIMLFFQHKNDPNELYRKSLAREIVVKGTGITVIDTLTGEVITSTIESLDNNTEIIFRTEYTIDEIIEGMLRYQKFTIENNLSLDLIIIEEVESLNGLKKKTKSNKYHDNTQTFEEFKDEHRKDSDSSAYMSDEDLRLYFEMKYKSHYYSDSEHIFSKLEKFAEKANVPIVCTSTASRDIEYRSPQIPTSSDVTIDSLKLKAHTVLSIYREDYYNPNTARKNVADIFLHENGTSRKDVVELKFKDRNFQETTSD